MASISWGALLKSSFNSWNEDKALRLSAALAYYATFSIAPLLVIAMGIAGLVYDGEAASGQMYESLKGHIGAQAAEGVQAMVKSASKPAHGIIATLVGFIMLMIGASGVLAQLKDALDTVWGVKPKPGLGFKAFARERFLNFGMVLAIGFLLLASLVMNSLLTAVGSRLGTVLSLHPAVWWIIGMIVSLGLTTGLLAMIFKYLPDAKVKFSNVWLGAALTAVLLELGKAALGWYLGLESTANAYGTAGSVVLLLLWVYYTSCIVLFGAEFTRAHAKATGHPIEPSDRAELVTHEERMQQGTDAKGAIAPEVVAPFAAASSHAVQSLSRPPTDAKHHRMLEPFLKYIEGRMALLGLETKAALSQVLVLLLMGVVAAISLFVIWLLLTTALIGWLTDYLGGGWVKAVLITAGVHTLVVGGAGAVFWLRFRGSVWFADTINEFKKDRQWLKSKNPKT